jgi:hypothetical protein
LPKPIYPGERGGKVIIELRLDGTMAIRLGNRYLNHHEIPRRIPEDKNKDGTSLKEVPSPGVKPTNGRSGRTPAEPYPPGGAAQDSGKGGRGPAKDHPWRRPFKRQK